MKGYTMQRPERHGAGRQTASVFIIGSGRPSNVQYQWTTCQFHSAWRLRNVCRKNGQSLLDNCTHLHSVILILLNMTYHALCCGLTLIPIQVRLFLDIGLLREGGKDVWWTHTHTPTAHCHLSTLSERSYNVCKLSCGWSISGAWGFLLLLWQYCWSLKTIKLVELQAAGGNYRHTETKSLVHLGTFSV